MCKTKKLLKVSFATFATKLELEFNFCKMKNYSQRKSIFLQITHGKAWKKALIACVSFKNNVLVSLHINTFR